MGLEEHLAASLLDDLREDRGVVARRERGKADLRVQLVDDGHCRLSQARLGEPESALTTSEKPAGTPDASSAASVFRPRCWRARARPTSEALRIALSLHVPATAMAFVNRSSACANICAGESFGPPSNSADHVTSPSSTRL